MWIQDVPDGNVVAATHSPDGGTLYTLDSDRGFIAWNLATHQSRRLFEYPEKCSNHFPRMSTSPDGRFLVANTSPASVWNLAEGALHAEIPAEYSYAGVSMGVGQTRIECVSNDWLGIRIWDFVRQRAGDEMRGWEVSGTIKTHHFSPDGSLVALLNWSDVVTVCETESRRALHTIDSPKRSLQHCRFAPDGTTLVLYAQDHIAIWDMAMTTYRVEKIECDRPYWMLAFHPTASVVALRRRDGLLSLVSLETGQELRTLDFDAGKQQPPQSPRFSPVICAAFSPDGLTCAVGGSNKQFAVFDVDV